MMFLQFVTSDFLYKAYVVGSHLNCIDKSMQLKWVPAAYVFIKKWTKSTLAVITKTRLFKYIENFTTKNW